MCRLVEDYPVADVGPRDVCVDMLMCPVNPADINQIQGVTTVTCSHFVIRALCITPPLDLPPPTGVYAVKPPLPAVGGGEGVGRVTKVGANVTSFAEDDWVVPATTTLGKASAIMLMMVTFLNLVAGTWRTKIVADTRNFVKISKHIPMSMAATISVNPTTAYRMIKSFVSLKPGRMASCASVCMYVLL